MVSSWVHTELKAKLDAQESLYQGSLSQSLMRSNAQHNQAFEVTSSLAFPMVDQAYHHQQLWSG